MTDLEIFNEVLDRLVSRYHYSVEKPYSGCEYIEFKDKQGNMAGGFNPEGVNIISNLKKLCMIFEGELL